MAGMKCLWIGLVLMAGVVLGQETAAPQGYVEGRVVEAGTGSPVREAVVRISYEAPPKGEKFLSSQNNLGEKATTGDDGSFRLAAPADLPFHLQVECVGFVSVGSRMGRAPDAERIKVKEGETKSGVTVKLAREASMAGRIVDRETGAPIAGLDVSAIVHNKQRARANWFFGVQGTKTDGEGRFHLSGLREGEYRIMVQPRERPKVRALSKDEFEAEGEERKGYPKAYYPGVAEADQAATILVSPGAQLDGLDFQLEKETLQRLKGRLVGMGEESVDFGLAFRNDFGGRTMTSAGKLERVEYFVIENLPRGPMHLMVFNKEATRRGNVGLDLQDKEEKVVVLADSGAELRVELVPPVKGAQLHWHGLDRFGVSGEVRSVDFQEDGVATFPGRFFDDPALLNVSGLPEGWAVKKATYGGPVDPQRFVLDRSQGDQKLVLEVGKLASSIAGRVKRGNEAEAGAYVFAIREPLGKADFERQVKETVSGPDGAYSLRGLAPGTWRVVAGAANDYETYGRLRRGEGTRVEVKDEGEVALDFRVD